MADATGITALGLAALAVSLGQQGTAPDGPFARALQPGQHAHLRCLDHPTTYVVHARLDGQPEIAVRAHISLGAAWTNTSTRPTDELVLRVFPAALTPVTLSEVQVDGRPAPHRLDGTLLHVRLPRPARPGTTVALALTVDQEVPAFGPPLHLPEQVTAANTGAYGRADGVVNLGYWLPQLTPFGPGGWDARPLPRNGEHAVFDPALWSLTLDLPRDWMAATSGVTTREVVAGDRREITAVAAMTRELTVEASPHFRMVSGTVAGTEIRVWSPETRIARDLLADASDALRFYTARFGPLPQRELDVVDAPVAVALGTEFPGLFTVDAHWTAGGYEPGIHHTWTVAHEVGHQWWYADVGSDARDAPWLDEALTSWTTGHYWQHRFGRAYLDDSLEAEIQAATAALEEIGDVPAGAPGEAFTLSQYGTSVYLRGSVFFHRLADEMGHDAFEEALTRYRADQSCQIATEADLLDALRASAEDPSRVDALHRWWITEAHGFREAPKGGGGRR